MKLKLPPKERALLRVLVAAKASYDRLIEEELKRPALRLPVFPVPVEEPGPEPKPCYVLVID